jgi:CMP-N,N'-diacetyllegionaminic acid synthase
MRPAELATDEAATELALIHALDWLHDADGFAPDLVLTLEPTSPLRTARLIDVCVETLLADNTADSVVTVTETRDCLGTVHDGRFAHLDPTQPRRRQDRQPLYKENSAVYVTRVEVLRSRRRVLGDHPRAVVATPEEVIDINTPLDFAVAEAVMRWRDSHAPRDSHAQ